MPGRRQAQEAGAAQGAASYIGGMSAVGVRLFTLSACPSKRGAFFVRNSVEPGQTPATLHPAGRNSVTTRAVAQPGHRPVDRITSQRAKRQIFPQARAPPISMRQALACACRRASSTAQRLPRRALCEGVVGCDGAAKRRPCTQRLGVDRAHPPGTAGRSGKPPAWGRRGEEGLSSTTPKQWSCV